MQMPGGFHEHENDMADSDFEPATATTGTDSEEEYDMEFEGDEVDDEDIDAELAEAERLARAADDSDLDPDDIEEDAQGDRTGGSLQLGLNSRGQLFVLSADGEATPISQSLLSSIPGLRQLIADSGVLGGADQDDGNEEYAGEESSEDEFSFYWPRRRRTGPKPIIFPIRSEPDPKGVSLARSGEFGHGNTKYLPKTQLRSNASSNNLTRVLREREYQRAGTAVDKQRISQGCVPNSVGAIVSTYHSNPYCGNYSEDGSFYYTCGQDFKVRIYDTSVPPTSCITKSTADSASLPVTQPLTAAEPEMPSARFATRRQQMRSMFSNDESVLKEIKTVQGRSHFSRWTITDANLSPLNDALIYSSIGPVVSFVRTKEGEHLETMSTDASDHAQLNFAAGIRGDFGIWSIRFSSDAREIVAGASQGDIFVYDIEQGRSTVRIAAHADDVNAVDFADAQSSNVLVSGSDDSLIKVWDRRSMKGQTPSGVLVGHTEGITFTASKGDGRYVVSNGKDQTAKLWDLRMMYSPSQADQLRPKYTGVHNWDYRGALYDEPRYRRHPNDVSVCTYTGHSVLSTLIRCHFSPAATTGQQYIYSGSADGRIHVWNLDGTIHTIMDRRDLRPMNSDPFAAPKSTRKATPTPGPRGGSRGTIRDVSWHPYRPEMMAVSWEGRMGSHGHVQLHRWVD